MAPDSDDSEILIGFQPTEEVQSEEEPVSQETLLETPEVWFTPGKRQLVRERMARRAIEALICLWMSRDPSNRTLFEARVRFEEFEMAKVVMELGDDEVDQWRMRLGTVLKRLHVSESENITLEDSWLLARSAWRKEPLLRAREEWHMLLPATEATIKAIVLAADDARPIIFGQEDEAELLDIPVVRDGLRAAGEDLRRANPAMPAFFTKTGQASRLVYVVLQEARFHLLKRPQELKGQNRHAA